MDDLTILYLTSSKVPKSWADYQMSVLKECIGDTAVISISREPMDFGVNLIQTEPISASNVYWQMLRGALLATTKYIAIAEDDVLYVPQHFTVRPNGDEFAYNMSRFNVMTWRPLYYWVNRVSNAVLIAPRELMVEALEERFAKFPEGLPHRLACELGRFNGEVGHGMKRHRQAGFYTTIPVVHFHHQYGMDALGQQRRKRLGVMLTPELCHWGKAEDLVQKFQ